MHKMKFSKEKFKVFHPGGNIGNSLLLAKDIMVSGNKMPTINFKKDFKEALKTMNKKNLGIIIVLKNNYIAGIITDGDLRRELNKVNKNNNLEKLMTKNPFIINESMPASKALAVMSEKKITSLLVASDKSMKKIKKNLRGIIHIHSLLKNGIK